MTFLKNNKTTAAIVAIESSRSESECTSVFHGFLESFGGPRHVQSAGIILSILGCEHSGTYTVHYGRHKQ